MTHLTYTIRLRCMSIDYAPAAIARRSQMQAIVYRQYGSPDVLELREVPKPVPREDEALVRVHAASVNPLDWHVLRGKPYLVRTSAGWRTPKRHIPGVDVAGVVEAVGSRVTDLKPGDEVYGEK